MINIENNARVGSKVFTTLISIATRLPPIKNSSRLHASKIASATDYHLIEQFSCRDAMVKQIVHACRHMSIQLTKDLMYLLLSIRHSYISYNMYMQDMSKTVQLSGSVTSGFDDAINLQSLTLDLLALEALASRCAMSSVFKPRHNNVVRIARKIM